MLKVSFSEKTNIFALGKEIKSQQCISDVCSQCNINMYSLYIEVIANLGILDFSTVLWVILYTREFS